jgi:hypothetical protein
VFLDSPCTVQNVITAVYKKLMSFMYDLTRQELCDQAHARMTHTVLLSALSLAKNWFHHRLAKFLASTISSEHITAFWTPIAGTSQGRLKTCLTRLTG